MKPIQQKHDQDPLKAFIDAQREAFDNEEPRASVWEALERSMPTQEVRPSDAKTVQLSPPPTAGLLVPLGAKPETEVAKQEGGIIRQLYPFWRKAAVACMLLTIGVLGGLLLAGDRSPAMAEAETSTEKRVERLEQYYKREIDRRLAMVASYKPEPELRRELSDMAQSDFLTMQPIEEILPSNERVVLESIAQEYQAKLDALERVLSRLRQAEQAQPRLNQPGPRGREEL